MALANLKRRALLVLLVGVCSLILRTQGESGDGGNIIHIIAVASSSGYVSSGGFSGASSQAATESVQAPMASIVVASSPPPLVVSSPPPLVASSPPPLVVSSPPPVVVSSPPPLVVATSLPASVTSSLPLAMPSPTLATPSPPSVTSSLPLVMPSPTLATPSTPLITSSSPLVTPSPTLATPSSSLAAPSSVTLELVESSSESNVGTGQQTSTTSLPDPTPTTSSLQDKLIRQAIKVVFDGVPLSEWPANGGQLAMNFKTATAEVATLYCLDNPVQCGFFPANERLTAVSFTMDDVVIEMGYPQANGDYLELHYGLRVSAGARDVVPAEEALGAALQYKEKLEQITMRTVASVEKVFSTVQQQDRQQVDVSIIIGSILGCGLLVLLVVVLVLTVGLRSQCFFVCRKTYDAQHNYAHTDAIAAEEPVITINPIPSSHSQCSQEPHLAAATSHSQGQQLLTPPVPAARKQRRKSVVSASLSNGQQTLLSTSTSKDQQKLLSTATSNEQPILVSTSISSQQQLLSASPSKEQQQQQQSSPGAEASSRMLLTRQVPATRHQHQLTPQAAASHQQQLSLPVTAPSNHEAHSENNICNVNSSSEAEVNAGAGGNMETTSV